MRVQACINAPPTIGPSWEERWEGPDKGLILCWLTGIEKGHADPLLAAKALAGELPLMGWKGGIEKPIKAKAKIGSTFYLATWQGLRGESLDIELGRDVRMTCARTGITFTYTDDLKRLGQIDPTEEE